MPDLKDKERLPDGVRAQAECPPVALVRAWQEGALPDELIRDVAAHMSDCALCRTLLADLDQISQPAITSAERDRIRRRLPVIAYTAEHSTGWHWYATASAAAALVIAGIFLTVRLAERPHVAQNEILVTPPARQTAAPPQIPAQVDALSAAGIQISKLAPPLDLSPGLILRGEASSTEPTMMQLTPAFRAYNSGDYALATQLFSQLAKQFPRSGRPFLYLGVTQLLTNDNAAALFNLRRAEEFVSPSEKDAASWYRLAASARTQASDTAQLAHALCNRNGSTYAQQACQLEKALPRGND
ncbi:MAG: hypothetical protein JSS95_13585 [Acidobacteria bacterium]|nr:hypothetical protein [Acidobacteriota bacterium]